MAGWTGTKALEATEDDAPIVVELGCLVLPAEIEPSVSAFTVASTQWRWISNGWDAPRRVGLDYAGMRAAWSSAGMEPTPAIFDDVRMMEAEALRALAEA